MKNSKLILSLASFIFCSSMCNAQSAQRKGWNGTVKGHKTAMALLMGMPKDCSGVGACHNQIYAMEKQRELADKEVMIQFVQDGGQILGIYLTQATAKGKAFVTSEPIFIDKKFIENGKSSIVILPNNHKVDESLGEFGGVRFITKNN